MNDSFILYSSNRTFMELKFASLQQEVVLITVLIVPLWN